MSGRGAARASFILPRTWSRAWRDWAKASRRQGGRDGLDLQVHLDGGDAFFAPDDLEVHVPEVVLEAGDVGQDGGSDRRP